MKFLSHRGNTNRPEPSFENSPFYIDKALEAGFGCEIDVWRLGCELFLGHDKPQYNTTFGQLQQWDEQTDLLIHCKNPVALEFFSRTNLHFFWHERDKYTMTSRGIFVCYPNVSCLPFSIIVQPEMAYDVPKDAFAVVSDYVVLLKETLQ